VQQHARTKLRLLDHLVGAGEQRRRHVEAKRLRGDQVEREIELGRLLDRNIGGLRAPQNFVHIIASTPKHAGDIGTIGHESAGFDARPVTLPPGLAKLATTPAETGSFANGKTIGVAGIACFAAFTAATPAVTTMSTLSRANSAAISPQRSARPSAQRYSIATVRPSIQPSSRSRCTKAAVHGCHTEGVVVPMNPMVGSFVLCCACTTIGQVAAPPTNDRNSRRLMSLVLRPMTTL